MIEKVVGLAENLEPIALIGAGGVGKTSIALTVLHNDRIKKRFGDNRRFVRCDRFPASLPHFLSRLSKAIGAGIENPQDLTSLQPFLSSREMILFLDNAESILDPQGTDAREIYTTVGELSRFSNICLGITSRITTVPPHFKRPTISTLSMESACDIFYSIYDDGGRSEVISDLVRQLDFHALSIARDLLGVVAFYPQGIDKNNFDWLFPTIPNRKTIFDKFCLLSLTSRSNNFITLLAPIRDYLRPRDPNPSPLLCATKDHYFNRLSIKIDPKIPGFKEARWVVTEDVNVEHLLDIFTSLDMGSAIVWGACAGFMKHLYWHKTRYTVLGPKVEGLADDHPSKPTCLIKLSRLCHSVGNYAEQKRLLAHVLKLAREREDDSQVASALLQLSRANHQLGLSKEGIQQTKEALAIYERLGFTVDQAVCRDNLGRLFHSDGQFDAAEKATLHAIDLLPEKREELRVCQSRRSLGDIY